MLENSIIELLNWVVPFTSGKCILPFQLILSKLFNEVGQWSALCTFHCHVQVRNRLLGQRCLRAPNVNVANRTMKRTGFSDHCQYPYIVRPMVIIWYYWIWFTYLRELTNYCAIPQETFFQIDFLSNYIVQASRLLVRYPCLLVSTSPSSIEPRRL